MFLKFSKLIRVPNRINHAQSSGQFQQISGDCVSGTDLIKINASGNHGVSTEIQALALKISLAEVCRTCHLPFCGTSGQLHMRECYDYLNCTKLRKSTFVLITDVMLSDGF